MKKLLFIILTTILVLLSTKSALAIENPLSVPNNKFGIHILFTYELQEAASLVNSNGGDWGYVTIPIQSGDRDLEKWQKFMDEAKLLHVIPIIRLATEGDYFNTKVWRKPTFSDVLDFANFLNSLNWPTKNRYIIVFNEVNRSDEWGGDANPTEYAQILSYAVTVFKSKDQNFFVISSGFDNASINSQSAFNEYTFMTDMDNGVPGIFNQIDGLGSHSYPNPAFSKPPTNTGSMSIASFKYERQLAKSLSTNKDFPVFITETGWSQQAVNDSTISNYYKSAFETVWSDENIVSVTPFLLKANAGPFTVFSFMNTDGSANEQYKMYQSLPKVKGTPVISQKVLGEEVKDKNNTSVKDFSKEIEPTPPSISRKNAIETIFKWLLKL